MKHIELFNKTKSSFIEHQSHGRKHYTKEHKSDALNLLKHYPANELSRELGVCMRTLMNWRNVSRKTEKSAPVFLPIALNQDTQQSGVLESGSWVLKLPHQIELVIKNQSSKEMASFMNHLIKELSSCSI